MKTPSILSNEVILLRVYLLFEINKRKEFPMATVMRRKTIKKKSNGVCCLSHYFVSSYYHYKYSLEWGGGGGGGGEDFVENLHNTKLSAILYKIF